MQMILMHLLIHALAFLFVQDKPYNKDDDVIKATSFEVISTLRDVLKTSSLWRDHVQTYTQVSSLSRFSVIVLLELLESLSLPEHFAILAQWSLPAITLVYHFLYLLL